MWTSPTSVDETTDNSQELFQSYYYNSAPKENFTSELDHKLKTKCNNNDEENYSNDTKSANNGSDFQECLTISGKEHGSSSESDNDERSVSDSADPAFGFKILMETVTLENVTFLENVLMILKGSLMNKDRKQKSILHHSKPESSSDGRASERRVALVEGIPLTVTESQLTTIKMLGNKNPGKIIRIILDMLDPFPKLAKYTANGKRSTLAIHAMVSNAIKVYVKNETNTTMSKTDFTRIVNNKFGSVKRAFEDKRQGKKRKHCNEVSSDDVPNTNSNKCVAIE